MATKTGSSGPGKARGARSKSTQAGGAGGAGGHGGPGSGGGPGAPSVHGEHGGHPKFLAHHFDTPKQQHESGKTGMWLFLATEVLLFSGLFCAYAVYRSNHPEIFIYAHQYLDKTLGGINTLVLILSSLTAAWAVRAAQLGQRRLLIGLVIATLICGVGFMAIKGVEYNHKWKHGLLWGQRFDPDAAHGDHAAGEEAHAEATLEGAPAMPPADATPPATGAGERATTLPQAARGPSGLARDTESSGPAGVADGAAGADHGTTHRPKNVQIFFGIYFAMTGLHGLHVLAGMGAWGWILRRALRGDFSREYFTPVDLTALYWHLVDLIWIYLFPLLYLIH